MNHESENDTYSQSFRRIAINDFNANKFCSNSISHAKYTPLTFLPLFFFEQFQNYTNCFFLLVSIIQQFPEASFLGRYTTVLPLSVIMLISAIKEIIEDWGRHKADRLVNTKVVNVMRNFSWTSVEWRHVCVGDLVKVNDNEFFPADMVLLKSSTQDGVCYIETLNLDGENNLKIRNQVPRVNIDPVTEFRAIVECDLPNEFIYDFKGVMKVGDEIAVPVSSSNLLLRGSMLKNTSWIVGAVVYTGFDTKIMRNSSITRLKRSSISAMVNTQIIILFIIFLLLTLTQWALYLSWNNTNYQYFWYLPLNHHSFTDHTTLVLCLVFGVIYSTLIPISLSVMQELSRIIQAIFISHDLDMYYAAKDVAPVVKTSALNEDLGLVKYIFADKTGTLTKNVLEFKRCSADGVIYTVEDLRQQSKGDVNVNSILWHLFVAVTVCPGVIPVQKGRGISYFASSPDQKALVLAAHQFGITLVGRTYDEVQLNVRGVTKKYTVLSDFDFSSERKRTSVIVRSDTGDLLLYVIGADDVVLARCQATDEARLQATHEQVDRFASEGLRSMCVAMARISAADFKQWYPIFQQAHETLQSKEMLLAQAESLMVRNLMLVGCTAVEDKLQDSVPETIEALLEAGINVWMLTGDKQETALNIAYACRLLSPGTALIKLNSPELPDLRCTIHHHKLALAHSFGTPGNNCGLVVTGDCLQMLFDSPHDIEDFILLMLSCRAVVCCRTTPKQKALIVKKVQRRTHYVTLAIGDGANDVAMIQTANIGIGISGLEGSQAANAADYSIGQFKYLRKLLLVHGTWCYNRICKLIYFINYKNVFLVMVQFIYMGSNAWSGLVFFDRWLKMGYNVFLTSLPTLALGIFEQSAPASLLLGQPDLYKQNSWFNMRMFVGCLGNALVHALLLTWLLMHVFEVDVMWKNGHCDDYLMVGNVMYASLLAVVCFKSLLHTCYWTYMTVSFVLVSLTFYPSILLVLSHTWPYLYMGEDMPRMFEIMASSLLIYLYVGFVVVAVLACELMLIVAYRSLKKQTKMMYRVRPRPRSVSSTSS